MAEQCQYCRETDCWLNNDGRCNGTVIVYLYCQERYNNIGEHIIYRGDTDDKQ
jgi:hypothetical protein